MKNIEQTTNKKVTENPARRTDGAAATTAARTSSTTSVDTQPGVHTIDALDYDVIGEAYVQILGPLNAYKAQDIMRAVRNGLETSAILDAIEETAMAPRPSHYYLRAILHRYWCEGITTQEKAEADRLRRRHEQAEANATRWQKWYSSPEDDLPW